jgi:hypothetical protein
VTQQPGGSGPDLIGEFQRWLIRSSARGVGRQVTGQIRSALGRNQTQQSTGDVWETATNEPPDEAPECAWCPLCRAARLLRESKPGRDTRVTAVSDALGTVVQDAFSVLEAALATSGRPAGSGQDGKRGATQPKTAQPETAQQKTAQQKTAQPGNAQPGNAQPGTAQPKTAEPGTAQPKTAQPGNAQPGTAQPKTAQPGTAQPGTAQPKTAQPKTAQPSAAERRSGQDGAGEPGPGGEPGTAGQGPGKEPAPDSPEGPPDEPHDRG